MDTTLLDSQYSSIDLIHSLFILVSLLRYSFMGRLYKLEMASKRSDRNSERVVDLLCFKERKRTGSLAESKTDRSWYHLSKSTRYSESTCKT